MNAYSRDDERAIRVQRLVNDWTKSGLIVAAQRARMLPALHVELRRTNLFLRITLFLFGYLIVNSAIGLFVVSLNLGEDAARVLAFVAAVVFFALAEVMVQHYRLYHFGIEEAAAIASVSSMAIGAAMTFHDSFSILQALAAAAIGSFVVFRRYGYVYAGVAATLFAGSVPFGLAQSDTLERLLGMVVLLTIFFIARERRQDHDWNYPGDAYAVIEAVAWAALYFLVNLKLSSWYSSPEDVKQFYWATYVVVWILPIAGVWLAIRDRHRVMLDVNIGLALATLVSNKPYLGAESKPWDPILFGVMLIAISIGLRRWLAGGPNRSRRGFVAHRLLASEQARLAMAGTASVLAPGAPAAHPHDPGPAIGGGGRSGGAGASGTF